FLAHPLHFLWAEAARTLDLNFGFLVCAEIFGSNLKDTVLVERERHLNLWLAARRRPDAFQVELAQQPIARALGDLTLTLIDANSHSRLIVGGRREDLLLFGRDRCIALDKPGKPAAKGLDAQR